MKLFEAFCGRPRLATAPMPVTMRSIARTHIGHVRPNNEDRLLCCPDQQLWAVADGMGGHSLGDKAATIVVRTLADLADAGGITRSSIDAALNKANGAIFAHARSSGQVCGSTVAGLHIARTTATIFWAGDSRVYRLRKGYLERLSRDHSVVQDLADAGLITEPQARAHPQAHVITRALGVNEEITIDYVTSTLQSDDLFLLCSDGLSTPLVDSVILSLLSENLSTASIRLQDAALEAGGTDNISLILVRTEDADKAS